MEIIEYFTSENQQHWLSQIKNSDWDAGQYLYQLLSTGKFKDLCGSASLIFLLTNGENLVSYCTFATFDDIQPTEYSPWIGFVYTYPQYRGHHYAGRLLSHIENIALAQEKEYTYISTSHQGLYEHYGYDFFQNAKSVKGSDVNIYRKNLTTDKATIEERKRQGQIARDKIVEIAKSGIDMTAPCGFSCNHCFLGQWCGSCRSQFCSCSYATICDHGTCPNFTCSRDKNLEGCWQCPEVESCKKGFYGLPGKDGNVCKASALFIKKHGKAAHQTALTNLHKVCEFDKMQEVVPGEIEENIAYMEKFLNT